MARMLGRRRGDVPLGRLAPRGLAVLVAMADGKSNVVVATLNLSEAAVERHITAVFPKLELGSPN
jgi:DNA-binding NarL/FixJ family response regulator